jgi:hypothetical protein
MPEGLYEGFTKIYSKCGGGRCDSEDKDGVVRGRVGRHRKFLINVEARSKLAAITITYLDTAEYPDPI